MAIDHALLQAGLIGESAIKHGAPDRAILVSGGPSTPLAKWSLIAAPAKARVIVRQPSQSVLPAATPHAPSKGELVLEEETPQLRAQVEEWKHGSWYHQTTIMADDIGDLLRKLVDITPNHMFDHQGPLSAPQRPFWCGAVAYDMVQWTQPLRLQHPPEENEILTVLWRIENGVLIDRATDQHHVLSSSKWGHEALKHVETIGAAPDVPVVVNVAEPHVSLSPERHVDLINIVRESIRNGQFYQANIGKHWSGPIDHPYAVFQRLLVSNPAPYSAYLEATDLGFAIASSSPECLLENDEITVRTAPIKGTVPQGDDEEEAQRLREHMLNDDKERAEHRMLVDLMRHDIGTVCAVGSVRVSRFDVEAYANVQHLVSHVEGQFHEGRDGLDALQAVFPGGSITGCPRTMVCAAVDELEQQPRSFWTGSLGWVDVHTGQSTWNILIRTLEARRSGRQWTGTVGAGGGITIGSVPKSEVEESQWKANALLTAAGWSNPSETDLPNRSLSVHPVQRSQRQSGHASEHSGSVVSLQEALLEKLEGGVLFVDNLDSFSNNIVHAIAGTGRDVVVVHGRSPAMRELHDPVILFDLLDRLQPSHIVLGPGPGAPEDADLTMAMAHHAVAGQLLCPVLGVCLGHQALGVASGMRLVRSPNGPVHGVPVQINHDGTGLFSISDTPQEQTRYNSLTVEVTSSEHTMLVNATELGTEAVMGIRHEQAAVHGLQFHPESVGSPQGVQLIERFLSLPSDG